MRQKIFLSCSRKIVEGKRHAQLARTKSATPRYSILFAVLVLAILGVEVFAQEPFSLKQVISLLQENVEEPEIIEQVNKFKVNFALTRENTRDLIRAGASDDLLDIIEGNFLSDSLAITSPRDGDEAGSVLRIKGVSQKFPGKHLWLFAHRKGLAVWWPQSGEVFIEENGKWMQNVFLGQKQDVGFTFEILAIWVDGDVNGELKNYLIRGDASGSFPGIRLPDGGPKTQVAVKKVNN